MSKWRDSVQQFWTGLDKRKQYSIIAGVVAILIAILGWSYWLGSKVEYVPLFTNMEAKDAGDIVNKLKELKIPHQVSEKGTAILVSAKDVHSLRLQLASQGLPKGKKGFEIFEQAKFGTTEFQNKVNYLQAMQGELTRTIEELKEVETARVHIVFTEDSLYKKNQKPATASIMLKLHPGATISQDQIKGIVNLVAHSVTGLAPANITVVDNYAQILNVAEDDSEEAVKLAKANKEEDESKKVTLEKFKLTKQLQAQMQMDIQSLLDEALGNNRAAVRVTLELDFDKRLVDRQTFAPVVDDKGILRSSQDSTETYQGASPAAPGGVPGTPTNVPDANNLPGYVANNNNQPQSNYEKKETTKNYEINETKEKIVANPGLIKRVTAAVFIDDNLTAAQQESISRVVASAAGFSATRGDLVSVERVPFNVEMLENRRKLEEDERTMKRNLTYAAIGLTAIALIVLAFMYKKRQERIKVETELAIEQQALAAKQAEEEMKRQEELREERRRKLDAMRPQQKLDLDDKQSPKDEMSEEDRTYLEQEEALINMAKTTPTQFAAVLGTWLSEE